MEICEHMPQLAKMADKFAILRSLVGMFDDHCNFHTLDRLRRAGSANVGGRPSIGSVRRQVCSARRATERRRLSRYNGGSPGTWDRSTSRISPGRRLAVDRQYERPIACKPHESARLAGSHSARRGRQWSDGGAGLVHAAGGRRRHVGQSGGRPRSDQGRPESSASGTAE